MLQFMGSQRARHDRVTELSEFGGWELLHSTGGLSKPQWVAAYQDSTGTAPLSQTQVSLPTRWNKQEGQHLRINA